MRITVLSLIPPPPPRTPALSPSPCLPHFFTWLSLFQKQNLSVSSAQRPSVAFCGPSKSSPKALWPSPCAYTLLGLASPEGSHWPLLSCHIPGPAFPLAHSHCLFHVCTIQRLSRIWGHWALGTTPLDTVVHHISYSWPHSFSPCPFLIFLNDASTLSGIP